MVCTQLSVRSVEPLERLVGLIGFSSPSVEGFAGNRVGLHPIHSQVPVAGRGNRHLIEGVEVGVLFKQPFETQASLFEQLDVGLAVIHEFFGKVERLAILLIMPFFEFFFRPSGDITSGM